MKKTGLIVASLMLAGTAAMAVNVYSVNTVGYQRVNVASNLNMLALNWNQVGGVDTVAVADLMDATGLKQGTGFFGADQLYVWDPTLNAGSGGYVTYYLYTDGEWYEVGNDNLPTTNSISRGQGMWLRHSAAPTNVTFSGEVPMEGTNVTTFSAGKLTMFGSSYTSDIEINGPNAQWQGNVGTGFFGADQLYVWDPALNAGLGGYWTYYLYTDGEWYEVGNDNLPTTHVIPMGRGAWLKSKGPANTVLTEVRAY